MLARHINFRTPSVWYIVDALNDFNSVGNIGIGQHAIAKIKRIRIEEFSVRVAQVFNFDCLKRLSNGFFFFFSV